MLNYEFLEDKIINASELVSMIEAQSEDENQEVKEFEERIISLIFSHAIYKSK